jgi:RNA polymerase sigma factor (sigma-70 family)
MTPPDPNSVPGRLDTIPTSWSLVRQAHAADQTRTAAEARQALVMRYARAIRRYVGGMVKSREDADELAQDVMVRLLKGDFAGADPDRGRFRDLLKTAVRNMVRTYWGKQGRHRPADMGVELLPDPGDDRLDQSWLGEWQNVVLDHAWAALAEAERQNPKSPSYTVLRLRADYPEDTSDGLAARLSERLGTAVRADAARQMLRRARFRFAEYLVAEVEMGLAEPAPDRVEEELAALGLLEHVRDFLPPDWKQRGRLAEE